MADITWRQMAGPNFAGTAAAMDAGADRIGAATDLFSRAVGDQVKLQQQQQARLKADNTARALAELSGFKTVDELDAAAPRFNFDALIAQHGKDNIDAGVVAQQGALQRGIIEKNQLQSVDLANKTREAQEAPIFGKAKEEISSLVTQGKFDQATALANQYAPQITDASGLFGLVDQGRAAFTETQLATDRNARENTRAKQDAELHKYQVQEIKDVNNASTVINGIVTGKLSALDAVKDLPSTLGGLQAVTQAIQTSEMFNKLPTEVKAVLDSENGKLNYEVELNRGIADKYLQNRQITEVHEDPRVTGYWSSIGGPEQERINKLGSGEGVIADRLTKLGAGGAEWNGVELTETSRSNVLDAVRNKLKARGHDLKDMTPQAVAAATSGWTLTDDKMIDDGDIDAAVTSMVEFNDKTKQYKDNKKAFDNDKDLIERELGIYNKNVSKVVTAKTQLADVENKIQQAIASEMKPLEANFQPAVDRLSKNKEFAKWQKTKDELYGIINKTTPLIEKFEVNNILKSSLPKVSTEPEKIKSRKSQLTEEEQARVDLLDSMIGAGSF